MTAGMICFKVEHLGGCCFKIDNEERGRLLCADVAKFCELRLTFLIFLRVHKSDISDEINL